jgi:hypothetical protein
MAPAATTVKRLSRVSAAARPKLRRGRGFDKNPTYSSLPLLA